MPEHERGFFGASFNRCGEERRGLEYLAVCPAPRTGLGTAADKREPDEATLSTCAVLEQPGAATLRYRLPAMHVREGKSDPGGGAQLPEGSAATTTASATSRRRAAAPAATSPSLATA